MRVISGRFGGRSFDSPHGHRTHPMSEKIRGALFNMLGDIADLSFLDAFAGTGAVGFEAVSRGAAHVLAVELDNEAFKTIQRNATELGVNGQIEIIRKDVKSWSRNHKDQQFDVVVCDPPYDAVAYRLLHTLATHAKLGSLIVYSLPPDHEFKLDEHSYQLVTEKSYGDATLVFYRRIS